MPKWIIVEGDGAHRWLWALHEVSDRTSGIVGAFCGRIWRAKPFYLSGARQAPGDLCRECEQTRRASTRRPVEVRRRFMEEVPRVYPRTLKKKIMVMPGRRA